MDPDGSRISGGAINPKGTKRMHVVIWGINYSPEPTGIGPYTAGLAEFLSGRGLEVSVVTGFPYYPAWRKAPGDHGRLYRSEERNGVAVHRCWQYVPARPGTLRRILHEVGFVLTSSWRVLRLKPAALYIVVSPPLGLGPAAWLATRLKRSRYFLHVQDLQPDAAAGLGMLRDGIFLRLMYLCEYLAYRGAVGVAGISAGMTAALREKGVGDRKIHLLPNWIRARPEFAAGPAAAAAFRRGQAGPAHALLAVYSGNLGRKQGLEVLIEAAALIAGEPAPGRPIRLIIAGEGAGRAELERRLRARPLPGVILLPLQPAADYAAMLRAADVALVTQLPGTGQVCFPSKLLDVLAAGRPVITVADETSDLARAVAEGGFGRVVPAGDAPALARALQAAAADPAQLAAWAARTRWVERFGAATVLPRFEAVVRSLAAGPPETSRKLAVAPDRHNVR